MKLASVAVLGLEGCGPVATKITETLSPLPLLQLFLPLPQSPTETLNPTEIPTPVPPMIEVDGLKIPDPKASNPELFDLTSPKSPIVQFSNTFEVNPEEVGN